MMRMVSLAAMLACALFAGPVSAQDSLPDSINRFTLRVLDDATKADDSGNLVWYPTVTVRSLALLGSGATGENLEQLQSLGFPGLGKEAELGDLLWKPAADTDTLIKSAAVVLVRTGLPVQTAFVTLGKDTLGTRTFAIPKTKPVEVLNQWFRKTSGPSFGSVVTKELLENDPAVLILGAAQVDGVWSQPFGNENDFDGKFKPAKGDPFDLKLMTTLKQFRLAKTETASVVLLPVEGGASALLILPHEGKSFSEVLAELSPALLNSIVRNEFEKSSDTQIYVPSFDLKSQLDLIPTLTRFGVKKAFDPLPGTPAFKGMTEEDVYVAAFRQSATLQFDHTGFRGGAAEVVELRTKGVAPMLTFDRPFLALVVDKRGIIVTTAAIRNPRPTP